MKNLKNKISAAIFSFLMVAIMVGSVALIPNAHAQTSIQTFSYLNVSPNPAGVGQQVTVNFWLAVPFYDSEKATNMSVIVTNPSGQKSSLGSGNFTTDYTDGTFTLFTPTATGNYTFQMFYGGQTLTGYGESGYESGFAGVQALPSQSTAVTLVVQQTPTQGLPQSPLPTSWWQTPVNSNNVQNWYAYTGTWMGYAANTFAQTGGYNATGNYNPFTPAPASAHIIWTKPYCVGGVVGGELGNSEQSSNYWTTSQYDPKYAPIIMNGIEYSTWYTTQTGSSQGIIAIDLYNGQTLWTINTTNVLRAGMIMNFETIDQYGDVGPYIFATAGVGFLGMSVGPVTWYMYDGLTGQQVAQVNNAPSFAQLGQDSNGNIIGYVVNATSGTMNIPTVSSSGTVTYTAKTFNTATSGPTLEMFNLTQAFIGGGALSAFGGLFDWTVPLGTQYNWNTGLQWAVSEDATINGVVVQGLGSGMFSGSYWSGNTLVFQTGTVSVGETLGYVIEAGFNSQNGQLLWVENRTGGIYTPYTRITNTPAAADGVYVEINQATYDMAGYSLATGKEVWSGTLDKPLADGNMPNPYDVYDFETVPDTTTGVLYIWALGGDVWAVNMTNGSILWSWSTVQANGPAGTETPYGIFPLWVFSDEALAGQGSNTILYLSEGHEYSPPLFRGALELALNGTTGALVWDNLGFDDTATAVAYGVMTTFNAYDGQIYAYAQGPSKTTINAPDNGVVVGQPITITGSVTDVSPGASQQAVALNFPNGLPAVSDTSMTGFMEAVYEQQPMPTNITGVPVTISVLDSNGNYRTIGTTTSNSQGVYGFTWKPDIPGNYTVFATFAGSSGYYASSASTYFYASSAASATPAPTATPTSVADQYFVPAIAGLFVLIIVVAVVLALLVLRKHA